MRPQTHYAIACLISYPGQVLQCLNGANVARILYYHVTGPSPDWVVSSFYLFALLVTALCFNYLANYRARARALYNFNKRFIAYMEGRDVDKRRTGGEPR